VNGPQIALAIHFFGLMLWIGGAATASWMAASVVSSGASTEETGKALATVRSALLAIVAPGILLATIGGLARMLPAWSTTYAHAPWLHGKLAIGLVLGALHGVLVGRVRKASKGLVTTPGVFIALAVAYVALGLAAVFLAVVRPGE
jgi:putative membrane protein